MHSSAKAFALAILAFSTVATAAQAGCEGRKTTGTVVGGATGGVLGSAITHGSAVGVIGGAVVGGLAGHSIAADNCAPHRRHYRHGYYDRHGHWHRYASR
ncbi:MAG TPA: glycine zipper 2TM domain-containing protein [Rhizomicrobium sp.]|nr:glycine zipper 2TM domain-containing protein [Rhizomicrobium sp.]